MAFSVQNSLFEIHICRALEKKRKKKRKRKKKVRRYIGTSLRMYQDSKSIDQSFMTSLKIYLQQSKCRFLDVAHT